MARGGTGARADGRGARRRPVKRPGKPLRLLWALPALVLVYGLYVYTQDDAFSMSSVDDHVKWGSIGAERNAGIPYAVFQVLPKLFPEYLRGDGHASLGFLYMDAEGMSDLPVGFSRRTVAGVDQVAMNCGICHVGAVRERETSAPMVIAGMPANTVDLGGFQKFLVRCAEDDRFNADYILKGIDDYDLSLGFIERAALRMSGIADLRERLLALRGRFEYASRIPAAGPGRIDSVNGMKVLLDLPTQDVPIARAIGTVDHPSVWNQRKRARMRGYWDGNNDSVEERHLQGALSTGATEDTIDLWSVQRIQEWLWEKEPPSYPFAIDAALAERGAGVYRRYCQDCHGRNGRDFSGSRVGTVVPLAEIRTDPHRARAYTAELAEAQNTVAVGASTFSHFEKLRVEGYAAMPLDGIWLRAPYLHNGSVPSLRDLLEPSSRRPRNFYRGSDLYDQERVGFVYQQPRTKGRRLFMYRTREPGNSSRGHEGRAFGTFLSPGLKDALVEYLKTF